MTSAKVIQHATTNLWGSINDRTIPLSNRNWISRHWVSTTQSALDLISHSKLLEKKLSSYVTIIIFIIYPVMLLLSYLAIRSFESSLSIQINRTVSESVPICQFTCLMVHNISTVWMGPQVGIVEALSRQGRVRFVCSIMSRVSHWADHVGSKKIMWPHLTILVWCTLLRTCGLLDWW